MKKILTLLVFLATISIFALLSFGLDLHVMFSGMFTGSVSWIVAHIFYENVKDEKIKNPIKKLFFWLRYKRVQEVVKGECNECVIYKTKESEYCINVGRAEKCLNTKTIVKKRNFNIFSWIKKIFTLLLICTLLSSCSIYVNCNINKPHQKNNSSQQDSTQTETQYWF